MSQVLQGDCLDVMKTMPDNSVDAIICDPPYGLSFMGKKWDYDVPSVEIWQEALRVLKPGGYLLAFAGTRTQHRMAVRIEDAGFEIRDMIAWIYGSGFPKSLNIGKSVDKIQGNEREVVDTYKIGGMTPDRENFGANDRSGGKGMGFRPGEIKNTKGTSQWEGWGSSLKPALEPITVARKPLDGTIAQNCLKWGVGGINIDGCRVKSNEITGRPQYESKGWKNTSGMTGSTNDDWKLGRFPANLIHDGSDEVVGLFPNTGKSKGTTSNIGTIWGSDNNDTREKGFNDSGSAARFFYCAKSSRSERNKGLDGYLTVKYNGSICKEENMVAVQLLQKVISEQELVSFNIGEYGESITAQCHKDSLSTILTEINRIIELKIYNSLMHSLTNESTQDVNLEMESGGNLAESVAGLKRYLLTITKGNQELALGASRVVAKMLSLISEKENWKQATNFHSTVKPIALMEYLVKLVSPENSIVLDPFAGSGSTLIACKNLGREYIGIEMNSEYIDIINARLAYEREDNSEQLRKV